MSEAREQAFELYRNGLTLKEIANSLKVAASTIRSWKLRDRWDSGTATRNACNTLQRVATEKRVAELDVEQVCGNDNLTPQQQLFCLYYVRSFNATKAYMKANDCDYRTANANGYTWLSKPAVRDEINRLKQNRLNREMLSQDDIVQKYIDIAFTDITDFIEFNAAGVRVRPSSEVDGTLLNEVSETESGIRVKLADRMKALDWLAEHMDILTEEQKVRIEAAKVKLPIQDDDMEDDGFLAALEGKAAEDWDAEGTV